MCGKLNSKVKIQKSEKNTESVDFFSTNLHKITYNTNYK